MSAADGLASDRLESLGLGFDAVVEADDGEAIPFFQLAQDELQRLPGLLDLLAGHGAGAVNDEDDVLGSSIGLGHAGTGREQEQEVALASPFRIGVGQQASAERLASQGVVQLEVLGGQHVLGMVGGPYVSSADPVHGELVAWRVDMRNAVSPSYPIVGAYVHFHRHLP